MSTVSGRLATSLSIRPDLVPAGCHVLVAYSGGPDSTALLHLLSRLRTSRRIQVSAAHFDHGLRPESIEVAARCVQSCESIGVECHVGHAAGQLPFKHAALRSARYEFLAEQAADLGATRIATGHQADDQAETVLLRIQRGTGLRGLRGIPAHRGPIVRPLLDFRRLELLQWLRDNGIPFEEDPANADLRWSRARVRHMLVPALEVAIGSDPVPSLVQLADRASAVERLIGEASESLLSSSRSSLPDPVREEFARQRWLSEPPLMRAESLRLWARRRGIRLSRGGTRVAIEFITRGRSGGSVQPAGNLRISRSFGTLVFEIVRRSVDTSGYGDQGGTCSICAPGAVALPVAVELAAGRGRGLARIGGRAIQVGWNSSPGDGRALNATGRAASGCVALAVGAEHYPLRIREWMPGDRIHTRGGTRKLKKLFAEHRISCEDRRRRPVLVGRSGQVIWVSGVAVADWARSEPEKADLLIEIDDV